MLFTPGARVYRSDSSAGLAPVCIGYISRAHINFDDPLAPVVALLGRTLYETYALPNTLPHFCLNIVATDI